MFTELLSPLGADWLNIQNRWPAKRNWLLAGGHVALSHCSAGYRPDATWHSVYEQRGGGAVQFLRNAGDCLPFHDHPVDGTLAVMSETEATGWFHLFVWAVYLTPLMGAILADYAWGKYRTIIRLSIVYCLGHLALALDDRRLGLLIGLLLISLACGGIKGCVSAHVAGVSVSS